MATTLTTVATIKEITDNPPWYEVLTTNGQKFSTQKDEIVEGLTRGMVVELTYSETQKPGKNGQMFTNRYLQKWGPATGTAEVADTTLPDDNPWPGKDRAVAMESAYKTAADFLSGRETLVVDEDEAQAVSPDLLHGIAKEIYRNIEAARAGVIGA